MSRSENHQKHRAENSIREIRRRTRRRHSAEEKIRIVLKGLRGEDSIAELCRRKGINQNLYYRCIIHRILALSASQLRGSASGRNPGILFGDEARVSVFGSRPWAKCYDCLPRTNNPQGPLACSKQQVICRDFQARNRPFHRW